MSHSSPQDLETKELVSESAVLIGTWFFINQVIPESLEEKELNETEHLDQEV